MKTIKRFFWTAVVVALCAGAAYGWYAQSVYYAAVEAGRAAQNQDVKRFERFVNLEAMGENTTKFVLDIAEEDAKKDMGVLGKIVVGGLAKIFGDEIAEVSGVEVARDVREKIAAGEAIDKLGPFQPDTAAFPPVSVVESGDGFIHTKHEGTCYQEPTSVTVVWVRSEGEYPFLKSWRAQSVTRSSLKGLLKACERGEKKNGKKAS